jgi:hypothetical protein
LIGSFGFLAHGGAAHFKERVQLGVDPADALQQTRDQIGAGQLASAQPVGEPGDACVAERLDGACAIPESHS